MAGAAAAASAAAAAAAKEAARTDKVKKAEFQLAYDGPALRGGTMDVNELASSLLAVGDLVREANRQINGERASVSIRVRSDFRKGSFEVALLLDQTLIEQAKNLLPGIAATLGGAGLVRLLFGTEAVKKGALGIAGSVLDVWKKLKGDKAKEIIEDKAKGITILVVGNGNTVSVDPSVASLYGNEAIRSSVAGIVRPLAIEGIKSLEIRKGAKSLNVVQKDDLPVPDVIGSSSSSSDHAANVRTDRRITDLRVVRANFEKGKWGFFDGVANFSADITDSDFKQKLDEREIGFFKGDMLSVVLVITQVVTPDGQAFQTTYEIEKVLNHRHAPKQHDLLREPHLGE